MGEDAMRVLSGFGKFALALLVLLIAANLAGCVYEHMAEARDAKLYPPPGQLVDVGVRRLHVLCTGPQAGPTVVIIPGGGTPAVVDYALQDRIARFARVCSYDRPGLGWSPAAGAPVSLDDDVADLHALLNKVAGPGPYVLEPESFGGLIALSYTRQYPREVGGLVLVDAAEPKLWFERTDAAEKAQGATAGLVPLLTSVGVVRAIVPSQLRAYAWGYFSPRERDEMVAVFSRQNPGRTEAFDVASSTPSAERGGLPDGAFGDLPMVVIQHGKPFTGANAVAEPGWAASEGRLARLSSNSRMIVARDNGHEIAQQNPDLVADAAREVVEQVRARSGGERSKFDIGFAPGNRRWPLSQR
jgi:pimeloyl-ACP methyl ester carboxylesterase